MPWLVEVHDEASTVEWMQAVLARQDVWVAEADGVVVGFAAVDGAWLEQLYVAPQAWGRGVGGTLLAAVRAARPGGVRLHVFARNERARRFYEAAGFVLTATGDGSGNEEGEPDCTYAWRPLIRRRFRPPPAGHRPPAGRAAGRPAGGTAEP